MRIDVTTAPVLEPLTTAEAKKQCEIETSVTAHDDFLDDLIKAARIFVEKETGLALLTQTVVQYWDDFPSTQRGQEFPALELGPGKIQSVTHLKYIDTNGDEQTLTVNTDYKLSLTGYVNQIVPAYSKSWPASRHEIDAVWCEYVRGEATVAAVDELLKRAMLLMVNTWFECRNDSVRRYPTAAMQLLDKFTYQTL